MSKPKIVVCTEGKTCRKRGGRDVYRAFEQQIAEMGPDKDIKLKKSDCLGHCGRGPTVKVKPHKAFYGGVSAADCADIISSLIAKSI